jgi:nucleotide-binding universal stress UspA family protein
MPEQAVLRRAVVGIDFSPATEQLVDTLSTLSRLGVRELALVHVIGGHYPQAPEERHRPHYASRLDAFATRLAADLTVTGQVRAGHVGAQLLAAATEVGADVLVVGSRGHTPWRNLFLGSTALELARTSRRPVLLLPLPPRQPRGGGGVVLATDASWSAAAAERLGTALAAQLGGVVVTVLEQPDQGDEITAFDPDAVRAHLLELTRGVMEAQVERGPLPEAIARIAAERDADLIVVGVRGRTALTGLLLGSTAEQLLRTAGRPVLLVREWGDTTPRAPVARRGGTGP